MKILIPIIENQRRYIPTSMMLFLQTRPLFQYWQHALHRKNFASLSEDDLNHFHSILPEQAVIQDADLIEPHNLCFRKLDKGQSKLMLLPTTTDQISKILSHCNNRRLAVVPQCGNTGLVGGSVPVFDEIIINLKNTGSPRRCRRAPPVRSSSRPSASSGTASMPYANFEP